MRPGARAPDAEEETWKPQNLASPPRPDDRQRGRSQLQLPELLPELDRRRETPRWSPRQLQATLTRTSQMGRGKQRWCLHHPNRTQDPRAALQHLPEGPGDQEESRQELKPVPEHPKQESGCRMTFDEP